MNLKTDTILVGISVILGLIATMLFIVAGLFKSPITNSLMILTLGTGVLYFTGRTNEKTLVQGGQVLFSITSITSVLYIVTVFESGQLLLSGVFAVFAIAFLVSAYFYTTDKTVMTEKRVKISLVIIAVIFAVVLVVDITSSKPTSEVSLNNNVSDIDDSTEYKIGKLEITNPSILPQSYDYPRHEVCITGIQRGETEDENIPREPVRDSVLYSDSPDLILGSQSSDITVRYPIDNASGVKIKSSDRCPSSTSETVIHFLGSK